MTQKSCLSCKKQNHKYRNSEHTSKIIPERVNTNVFDILVSRPHIIWIRSKLSGDEFVITDYALRESKRFERYPWNVMHRHPGDNECHYHANEKTFEDAIRHITAHDRGAARKQNRR